MNDFIEDCVKQLKNGFSREQVQEHVWRHMLREYGDLMRLDSLIFKTMEVYSQIILKL